MRAVRWVPFAALALGGCATSVEGGPDTEATQVHAYLRVDQQVDGAGSARTRSSASFLRVHDDSDPAVVARLVGAAPTLPPAGGCTRLDGEVGTLPLRSLSPVELVQTEGVTLTTAAGDVVLSARAYPDVAHLVSGVVYTSPDDEGAPAQGHLSFHVAAGGGVPTLDVPFDAPDPPHGVRINGLALGESALPTAAAPLRVTWDDGRGSDAIYADFAVSGAGARYRCTADSEGLLGPAVAAPAGTRISITVHRLRVVPFREAALGSGEARFDAAVSGTISFDEPG